MFLNPLEVCIKNNTVVYCVYKYYCKVQYKDSFISNIKINFLIGTDKHH